MERVRVRMHSLFEELDEAPSELPVDDVGRPLSLELAMLAQFYECHPPPPADEAECGANSAARGERIQLPCLPRTNRSVESITHTLVFDESRPARYFRCRTQVVPSCVLETRFVHREGTSFLVFASYLVRDLGPGEGATSVVCYHFGTTPCDSTSPEDGAKATARQEIDDLVHLRRGPALPHFGSDLPLLRSSRSELGAGAFAWEYDPKNDTTTITIRNAMLDSLPRNEKRRVREELEALMGRLRLSTGEPPKYDRDELLVILTKLTVICDDLLRRLADGEWPPFGSHRAVDRFVEERYGGDREMVESLADALKGRERRPSTGRDLAIRVLATAAGLSRDHLRELSRV